MPQHITVLNYDPEWPLKYMRERDKITGMLKDNFISIYHIGSTSVPGLAAKPIIDIMVVVRSLERVDIAAEKFADIGYEYLGEFGIAGRRYFRKGGNERTHQIHIFQADDWNNTGIISEGTFPLGTICVPMKKSGTNMQRSKRLLHKSSLTT